MGILPGMNETWKDWNRKSRREVALEILNGLKLPLNASDDEVARAVREAYPWGPRSHHPYKAWLAAVKEWKGARAKLRAFSGG